ncbi:hypothetical protein EII20_04835 [Comamonadaceae bacterium OH2545_COT-014]|nr:hypothetical protein EII20_04835 [Comamonadaceae bacterium OH2545_COT-014]
MLADAGIVGKGTWKKLVIVGVAGQGLNRMFGYRFDMHDDWEAVSPDEGQPQDVLKRLQQAMLEKSPTGRAWVACLIRIGNDGRYGVDFEYEDAQRWAVTPRNLEQRIAEFAAMPV